MPPGALLRPDTLGAVQRNSLREQIAGAMREDMMAGRLPAGTRFTVKEIAELYGVSATPVREALVDLTAQDLLWMEPNRGFTVPQLSFADYLEVVEARTLVMDAIFRRVGTAIAAGNPWPEPAPERLESLRRRARSAAEAARSGQLDLLVGCDRRFWSELSALAGNRRMTDYLDWLRVQYWIFAASYLRARADIGQYCWSRHEDLADHMLAGDFRAVHRMLLRYNEESLAQMAELCGQSPDAAGAAGLRLALHRSATEAAAAAAEAAEAEAAAAGQPAGAALPQPRHLV